MFEQQETEVPFKLPVNLADEITIENFDTASAEKQYLVTVKGRRFQIDHALYRLLTLINGSRSLEELSAAYSALEGKYYGKEDITGIIRKHFLQQGIVKSQKGEDGINHKKKPASYLFVRIPLISPKKIKPFVSLLKPLFKPWFFTSLMSLSVIFYLCFFLTFREEYFSAFADSRLFFSLHCFYHFCPLLYMNSAIHRPAVILELLMGKSESGFTCISPYSMPMYLISGAYPVSNVLRGLFLKK